MLYHNIIHNLNLIFSTYDKVSNNPVEVASTLFSSFVLLSLLLASLGLTFHSKGTTVHKVLGLLLTSIFVVFLWMLQSQFLFIYVVYILAFISAVLMLFLSVVLMLPISTLTTKNTLTDQKSNYKAYVFASFMTQETITISAISSSLFIMLLAVFLFSKSGISLNLTKLYNSLVDYTKHQLQILNSVSNNKQTKFNITNKTFPAVQQYYSQIGSMLLNLQSKNTFFSKAAYNLVMGLAVLWTITNFTALSSVKLILETKQFLQYKIRIIIQLLKASNNLPQGATKVLWDAIAQTYLFITVVLSTSTLFLSKQAIQTSNANMLSESLQGLGQIKALLYGDFSLFLLFSTFVLLIALLGAAVMTRSKR